MLKYLKKSLTFEKSVPSNIDITPLNNFINLQQGKDYNQFKLKQIENNKRMRKRLNLIEGLENNTETQELDDYEKPLNERIDTQIAELKLLEDKFKQSLTEYSTKYKGYIEDILKYTKDEHLKYTNKNIITPAGKKYYVSNHGHARLYDDKSWAKKDNSCNVSTMNVSSDNIPSLGLTMGRPMKPQEPCGYEGMNVQISDKEHLINLSLLPGTTASQSSNYNEKNSFPASNAIDGNPKTFNHTGRGVGQWLEIKLPEEKFITNITIQNRLQCCRYRFKKVELIIYDNNRDIKFKQMIHSTDPNNQIYFYIKNINVIGKFVRLVQYTDDVADNQLHIGEIQIFGQEKTTEKNGLKGYVDINGMLHPYPNNDMTNTTGTCSDNIVNIDDITWGCFTMSDDMTPTTLCSLGSIDVEKKAELVKLNNDLIKQSENIYSKIGLLKDTIGNIRDLDNKKNEELNEYMKSFEHLFKEYNSFNKNKDTLEVMINDNSMTTESNLYYYILWVLITIILMIATFRYIKK